MIDQENIEIEDLEYIKKVIKYSLIIAILYVLRYTPILPKDVDLIFGLKNISSNAYFMQYCVNMFVILNTLMYGVMLIKLRISLPKGIKGEKNLLFIESNYTIPIVVFGVSLIPTALWTTIIILGENVVQVFAVIYSVVFVVLVLIAAVKFKSIRIHVYNAICFYIILIALIDSYGSFYTFQEKSQSKHYSIPLKISDIVKEGIDEESSSLEYYSSGKLASYSSWRNSASKLDSDGCFMGCTIFECDSQYLRDRVRNYNYDLKGYQKADKANWKADWKADWIYIRPSPMYKDTMEYYIEYEDKIITMQTNINLDKDKIEKINKLLIL